MKPKSRNISKTKPFISQKDKEKLLGQKGAVFWMTGLSGSGKSTIAHEVEKKLFKNGRFAVVLDGDNVRHGLNSDLGFSDEDRKENLRRIAEVAKLFAENGIIIITSFISPTQASRDKARDIISELAPFYEVYVECDIEECKKRDPKGLYRKVRNGEIKGFTGVDAPFEEPRNPDISISTIDKSAKKSSIILSDFIKSRIMLQI